MWGGHLKKTIFRYSMIVWAALVLPCLFTLFWNGKQKQKESEKAEKTISYLEGNEMVEVDVEEFLPCLLMEALEIQEEEELIKAQAVLFRTKIARKMGEESHLSADDLNLAYCSYSQMKSKWGEEYEKNYKKICKLVKATKKQTIYYKEKRIIPYYHYASAGMTRTGKEVMGKKLPYLKSVDSHKDVEAKEFLTVHTIKKQDFPYQSVEVTKRCSAGYVLELKADEKVISGDEFAKKLDLNSSCFYIKQVEEGYQIITKGFGHGLGMSIFGAKKMAEDGKSYEEILHYYYQKVELKP